MKILMILALATGFLSGGASAEEDDLESLEGIPVMAGLVENLDARLVFDKPEGRIVHAQFGGSVSGNEIMAFYREALAQLGWIFDDREPRETRMIFTREGETLVIAFTKAEPLEVVMDLGPTPQENP